MIKVVFNKETSFNCVECDKIGKTTQGTTIVSEYSEERYNENHLSVFPDDFSILCSHHAEVLINPNDENTIMKL